MAGRYFEATEGDERRFWELVIDGIEVRTRHGSVGTEGRITRVPAESIDEARRLADQLVRVKLGRGYVELRGDGEDVDDVPTVRAAAVPTTAR
ncbi:MAG: WGR domain-containing protein [Myxococcota bacterium]